MIALSIGSHSCYLLLQQDFAARLIHLALLGIPLPRLYSDLKSSALGYLIAELIVRYEALQRVPIMVRAVDLFSSSGKWARFEEQLATNICGLEVRAGMCVGDCSYSLGFLVSDSLLKWLEPILNRGLIETMRDNRFHD